MATLINGNGNLAIYAQQDADWYAALMGGQTVITAVGNQFAYELLDANTIGVKDGVIITTEGRRIQLDANAIDSFDIPTGAQGTTNYYIIGYHLVTGDLSEQTCETFVQLMENGTDTIPEGSFRDGDDEVFISLYRVEQDDLTIGTITALLPQLSGSFQSQITELNNDLTANSQKFEAAYQNGKYGFIVDGTFYEIGGGGMPTLNYATPLYTFSADTSYTPAIECYLDIVALQATTESTSATGKVLVDNTPVAVNGRYAQPQWCAFGYPKTVHIKAGQTITTTGLRSYGDQTVINVLRIL
jgi:hypothetical protein